MSFKIIKNNKTHKFVGFEPMRLDFKSNSLSKSELQLRVFQNGQDGEIRTHDLLNPGKSWKIRTFI